MLPVTRAVYVEAIGTAFLLLAIVGSGIMAERLFGANHGLALLANALATGGTLVALIVAFGAKSGAHFNPLVTLALAWRGEFARRNVLAYVVAQGIGAIVGCALANVLFGLPPLFISHHDRSGLPLLLSEFVATFGLLLVILSSSRAGALATPIAVASYIVGAYWFTPSTSFANPVVTIARSMSDTFSGIRPNDVVPFIAAQLLAAIAATRFFTFVAPDSATAHQARQVAPALTMTAVNA